jgi:hypothetical protein
MKRLVASFVLVLVSFPASAMSKRLEKELRKLDPATRLEQVCDIEAMHRINHDPNKFHPDRAVLAATSNPETNGHVIRGSGGAFRSKGKWYGFSFKCEASDDHMSVISFDYKLGDLIPADQWSKDGLWQ